MNKVIGGEFELINEKRNINNLSLNKDYIYSSGRDALYNILIYLKTTGIKHHIFLPDYICDSVYNTCFMAGFEYSFYPINEDLTTSSKKIKESLTKGVILFVNYFGIIDNQQAISQIKKDFPDITIILDNVQAAYKMEEKTEADFCFTSLRKSFPLPDGAIVKTNGAKLKQYNQTAKFSEYKIAASFLKRHRKSGYYSDDLYLELYQKGEKLINTDINKAPSKFTIEKWQNIDIERFGLLRKRNTKVILEGLSELGISPITHIHEDDIPLFIPITVNDRDKLRRTMFAQNIFLPIHWPINDEMRNKMPHGSYFSDHELSIIVDQRYTEDDMNRILQVLRENI